MNNSLNKMRGARVLGLFASAVLLAGCVAQAPAPVRSGGSAAEPTRAADQTAEFHVVQPGDTLMAISRRYNRSSIELAMLNGLTDPNQIKVGQRLRVRAAGAELQTAATPDGVEIKPIDLSGSTVGPAPAAAPKQIEGPTGGTRAYSDEAWAAVDPRGGIPAPSTEPKPAAASAWKWPADGQVLEKFDDSTNKGIDISGKPGDPVRASAAGSVAYAGSGLRGYGKLVIINHDGDYYTAYAHNQALLVKEGDKVTQGQKIAEMGSTDADRPKLHFEIRRQGRPVDPMQYLPVR